MIILPPDDNQGRPFYADPPGNPGMHRDMFKAWALNLLGELHILDYVFTASALGHLPLDYRSDSSFKESEDDERSVSIVSEVDASEVDSSDEEGAHLPQATLMVDSSEEGGHLLQATQMVDSSDEEGAHLPQAVHLPRSGGGVEQRPH
jgi:hypothetical protein